MCLAHEMGHALNFLWCKTHASPPIVREICAFLGELAVLKWAHLHDPKLHQALASVWHAETEVYLTGDLQEMRAALANPDRAYHYRLNYPPARVAAFRLVQDEQKSAMAIYAGGTDEALSGLRDLLTARDHADLLAWQDAVTLLKERFPGNGDEIDRRCDEMIVDLSFFDLGKVQVIPAAPKTPILRVGRLQEAEDTDLIASGIAVGLAAGNQADEVAAAMAQSLGRGLRTKGLFEADPRVCDLFSGVSQPALYQFLSGGLPGPTIGGHATIRVVATDGQINDLHEDQFHQLIYWRSLGALALGALGSKAAQQTPQDFIEKYAKLASAGPALDRKKPPGPDLLSTLGLFLQQMATSDYHRQFDLSYYLPTEILPPLSRGQIHLYVDEACAPVGCITWAWISTSTRDDLHKSGRAMHESEWNSGPHLFFNDWFATRQAMKPLMAEMTGAVFPDQIASSLRRNPDGSVRRVNQWIGRDRRNSTDHKGSDFGASGIKIAASTTCHAAHKTRRASTCGSHNARHP
ncbi:toxin-activating lysine-acyltransferase [Cognatiyoonia sp. IB215182]|nr:toxin-activating lysine-acyltransferase [Cognatiyoonia sp. IB215182]